MKKSELRKLIRESIKEQFGKKLLKENEICLTMTNPITCGCGDAGNCAGESTHIQYCNGGWANETNCSCCGNLYGVGSTGVVDIAPEIPDRGTPVKPRPSGGVVKQDTFKNPGGKVFKKDYS